MFTLGKWNIGHPEESRAKDASVLPYVVSEITLASKRTELIAKWHLNPNALLIFLLWKEAPLSSASFMFPLNTGNILQSLWNSLTEENKMLPLDSPHFNDWIGTQHIVVAQ